MTDSPPPAPTPRLLERKVSAWEVFAVIVVMDGVLTLLGGLGGPAWMLENFALFRVQHFSFFVIATLIALVTKHRGFAVLAVAFGVWNGAMFVPLYLGAPSNPRPPKQLRVMEANLLCDNTQYTQFFDEVRAEDPDVLVLTEFSNAWAAASAPLKAAYPYYKLDPRDDAFGIAVFSRIAPVTQHLGEFHLSGNAWTYTELEIDNHPLTIIGVHVLPPANRQYWQLRNADLAELGAQLATVQGDLVMVGDLNTTSDTPEFRKLLRDSRLRDSRQGYGVQACWPEDLPLLKICIDHCLVSSELTVIDRHLGACTGSDHRPIIVDIARTAAGSRSFAPPPG